MASQVIFFEKNRADFSNPDATASASEAPEIAKYVLNRSNATGWMTSGSTDASGTTITVDVGDVRSATDILLLKHNFKSFKIEWSDDGAVYHAFTPAIELTENAESTNRFAFAEVLCRYFKITINGTQVPNSDKFLAQFIATKMLGQLEAWPQIKNPIHSRNKTVAKMLSGKLSVSENVGAFSMALVVKMLRSDQDLTLLESLFFRNEGFLVWPGGGDEAQFSSVRIGYRKEDLYLMKCTNDWEPEFFQGIYTCGIEVNVKLAEVVD